MKFRAGSTLIYNLGRFGRKALAVGYRRTATTTVSILAMILAAIVFAILAIQPFQDTQTHQAILTQLRSLDLNNASLQRDVLRAGSGLLYNYDPLVESVVGLHSNISALRRLFDKMETAKNEAVLRLLDDIQLSIDRDESRVESFKTQNSLLQNSERIFARALDELPEELGPDWRVILFDTNGLGNLMLQYISKHTDETASRITSRLNQLSSLKEQGIRSASLVVIHGGMILSALPQVRTIILEVQSSDTVDRAQRLQHRYLDLYGRANTSSQWIRVGLGAASVFLCLYAVMLVHRLRSQTDRLRRRVDFEEVIKGVRARFEAEDSLEHTMTTAMNSALDMVRGFFTASRCSLITVDAKNLEIRERFGEPAADKSLELDLVLGLVQNTDEMLHRDMSAPGTTFCPTDQYITRRALSLRLSVDTTAICIFEFLPPRPRPTADEAILLENAVRNVLQIFYSYKVNQERKKLEQRLDHAERLQAVGTLAGGIAHEFNNILAAILGYCEMVLALLRKGSATRHYVEEIVKAAERSRLIIDQILALSRKRERTHRPIEVAEVVDDIVALLRVSLPTGVELQTHTADGPYVIDGNPVDIQQTLVNLTKNASEAIHGPGCIRISLRTEIVKAQRLISHGLLPPGDYVVLSVEDSGAGIPPGVLPNIFEPFYTTRAKSGGTGLGLAAVHGNIAAVGGRIDVSSSPGEGTDFQIYLPRSFESPVPIRLFFGEKSVPMGTGEIVAVFERDLTVLSACEDQVAALGYEPLGISNWEHLAVALETAGNDVDLVVLDVSSIPSHITTTKLNKTLGTTPRIFCSEYPETVPMKIKDASPADVLRKPISAPALASAIRLCMGAAGNLAKRSS